MLFTTHNLVIDGLKILMELTSQASPSHMVHLVSTGPTSGPTQAATRNPFHMHVTVLVPSSREEVLHHMLVITIIVRVQHNIILLDHNIGSLTTHSGTIRTAIQEAIAAITPKLLGLLGISILQHKTMWKFAGVVDRDMSMTELVLK